MSTVIVSMPFMNVTHPSIQLGLLKAIGEANGFRVRTLHANLDLAALIGREEYDLLTDHRGPLVGDWLFSVEAFGAAAPDRNARLLADLAAELRYLTPTNGPGAPANTAPTQQMVSDRLIDLRDRVIPAFLDSLVDTYPWHEVTVVAFSCTFQQNAASFALARRLKRRHPGIITLFGGANFDGEMGVELVRAVDCIDLAVIGEGDTAFPRLLAALATGADPTAIPGVARRVDGRVPDDSGRLTAGSAPLRPLAADVEMTPPAPPLTRLDDLPTPDYTEYFERAADLGLLSAADRHDVAIPFESARGCWWGAKHHCTFCGLNGMTMQFRSKSPARVLDELARQARRYGSFRFEAVDNIMDMSYLAELFPAIVESNLDYQLFYEVKSNLTRAQLRLLAQGGVTRIQPGLESLNSHVLRLMDKGVRAAQNVNLLRWARYYGIAVGWNILWGFPGETAEDYAAQARLVPLLAHLEPPGSAAQISLERFSPLYDRPERFRLRRRRPGRSYAYIYPQTVDLDRVAYFFEYEPDDALPDGAYEALWRAVRTWSAAWETGPRPVLKYRSAPGYLQIYDGRRRGHEGTYTFRGAPADIYLACSERPRTAQGVRDTLKLDLPLPAVEEILDEYARRGLMFLDDSLALALALPAVAGR